MSTDNKQESIAQRKVHVMPHITDPTMRNKLNNKVSFKDLDDLDDTDEDLKELILRAKAKKKTKEEIQAEKIVDSPGTSMLLIAVFGLIVIALVALIVWMVVKQNDDKKDEKEEIKARLRPHPRNNLQVAPPYNHLNIQQQQAQQLAQQQQAQQLAQQQQAQQLAQQQARTQQRFQETNNDTNANTNNTVSEHKQRPIKFNDALDGTETKQQTLEERANEIDQTIQKIDTLFNNNDDDGDISNGDRDMINKFEEEMNDYNDE